MKEAFYFREDRYVHLAGIMPQVSNHMTQEISNLFGRIVDSIALSKDGIAAAFSRDFTGHLTDAVRLLIDRDEWIESARRELAVAQGANVHASDVAVKMLGANVAMVSGFLTDGSPETKDALPLRRASLQLILRAEMNEWKVVQANLSCISAGDTGSMVHSTPGSGTIPAADSAEGRILALEAELERFRLEQERFRQLVELFPESIFEADLKGRLTFANSHGLEWFGVSEEDVRRGVNIIELVAPEQRPIVEQRIRERLAGKTGGFLEYTAVRKNGEAFDAMAYSTAITRGGNIIGLRGFILNITERKRAEEALKFERLLLRTVIDNIPDPIYAKDLLSRKTLANLADVRSLRVSSESEALGKDDFAFYPRELAERFHADDRSVLQSGEPILNREEFSYDRDGGQRWFLTSKFPLRDAEGRIMGLAGIGRDITERKKAVQELSESESRFRQLAEAAAEGIVFSNDGIIVDGNARLAAMIGCELKILVGNPVAGLIAPESRSLFLARLSSEDEAVVELALLRSDGRQLPVEARSRRMTWDGRTIRAVSFLDISRRKKTEERLRILSLALEQSPASIVITDTSGVIEYVNPKFTEVTGYRLEEVAGKKPSILKSGETPPEEYQRLWEAITSGKEWRGELHNRKKNGELFWELAIISGVKDEQENVTHFLAVKEDITERKSAEEALRQSQKLESIGTLAGGIAHDFNNLLNAIMGQSSLALGKLPKESAAGTNIAKALKAAERASDLTRQLLAYSGKGKFLTEVLDLNRLVEENAQLLELSIPKTTKLRFHLDPSPLLLSGDASQIQQVIMNLIINAGEAMGSKPGHITILTRHRDLRERDSEYWKHTHSPLPAGRYAALQVNDTGEGISPEVLARIFDPFFTTKFTGRGLGLAAVLGIMKGHHGGVRIQSREGVGTNFEIVFPAVHGPGVSGPQGIAAPPPLDGGGKTVLVIDDEPAVVELLRDILVDSNFNVLSALDPSEGIDLYRREHTRIALVVLDYSMPKMGGLEAFRALTEIDDTVKVILCSGYTEEEIRSAFGEVRPEAFMKKPYRPSEFLERIRGMV